MHIGAFEKLVEGNIITPFFKDKIKDLLNNDKDFNKGRKVVLELLTIEHELRNESKSKQKKKEK